MCVSTCLLMSYLRECTNACDLTILSVYTLSVHYITCLCNNKYELGVQKFNLRTLSCPEDPAFKPWPACMCTRLDRLMSATAAHCV